MSVPFTIINALSIVDWFIFGLSPVQFFVFIIHFIPQVTGYYIYVAKNVLVMKKNIILSGMFVVIYLVFIDITFFDRFLDLTYLFSLLKGTVMEQVFIRLVLFLSLIGGNYLVYRKSTNYLKLHF